MIDLPVVVGEPGSPWTILGGAAGGLAVFLVMVRAIRIKRRRRLGVHDACAPVPEGAQT